MSNWRLILGILVGAGAAIFLLGALLTHRRKVRTGGVLMGLSILGVLGGAAWLVSAARSTPPAPPPIATSAFRAACERRAFFRDSEAVCDCAAEAFRAARAEHPDLTAREVGPELVVDGPRAGQVRFHARLAECAAPALERWVSRDCRAACAPTSAGCPSRCVCVGRRVRRERTAIRVAYMLFPEPGPRPADNLERAVAEAEAACRPSDPELTERAPVHPDPGNNSPPTRSVGLE